MPHRVFSAKPDGGFTYNATAYQMDGTDSEVAKLTYRRIKEEGTITLSASAQTFKVIHSTNSGIWHLQLDDPHAETPLIVARKSKWYRNTVTFELEGEMYEMVRPSIINRDYVVGRLGKDDIAGSSNTDGRGESGKKEKHKPGVLRGTKIGEVLAEGVMKRSYTVRFDDDIRVELILFCYWIVNLLNKRSSQSGAAAPSSG